ATAVVDEVVGNVGLTLGAGPSGGWPAAAAAAPNGVPTAPASSATIPGNAVKSLRNRPIRTVISFPPGDLVWPIPESPSHRNSGRFRSRTLPRPDGRCRETPVHRGLRSHTAG